MKILKNRGRKNEIIKALREADRINRKTICRLNSTITGMKINELEWVNVFTSKESLLEKENTELLEYKAKYYSLIKNLKI